MPPDNAFVAETTFFVRYAETDAQAIVHHASFIVYFEEGRSAYVRARGSDYASFEKMGYFLVVAEVRARYIQPAHYGTRVTVCTWIDELKSRGVKFRYEILNAESRELLVEGHTSHICITRDGRVARIPEEWRAWKSEV